MSRGEERLEVEPKLTLKRRLRGQGFHNPKKVQERLVAEAELPHNKRLRVSGIFQTQERSKDEEG